MGASEEGLGWAHDALGRAKDKLAAREARVPVMNTEIIHKVYDIGPRFLSAIVWTVLIAGAILYF